MRPTGLTNVLVYWRAGVQTEKNQMTPESSGNGDGSFYLSNGGFCVTRDDEGRARWKFFLSPRIVCCLPSDVP